MGRFVRMPSRASVIGAPNKFSPGQKGKDRKRKFDPSPNFRADDFISDVVAA
jgi:hypothetical protein